MKKIKLIFMALIFTLVLVGCDTDPEYEIIGVSDSTIYVDDVFDLLEGITATKDEDDITSDIVVYIEDVDGNTVEFNTDVPFVFYITYSIAEDTSANKYRVVTVLAPIITDTTPPVITGVEDITIGIYDSFDPLEGLVVTDDIDGDITNQAEVIIIDEEGTEILTAVLGVPGDYYVYYIVFDTAGNETTLTIVVTVVDDVDPVITAEDITINNDVAIEVYEYATASDNIDGDLTDDITYIIEDPFGNEIPEIEDVAGEYIITYTVIDTSGNEVSKEITITVIDVMNPYFMTKDGEIEFYLTNGCEFLLSDYVQAEDESDEDVYLNVEATFYDDAFDVVTFDTTIEGMYTVNIHVFDEAGNEKSIAITLNVGGTEPVPYDNPLVFAESDLDWFYYDVIISSMTIEAICDAYIGDTPFDWIITYEECLEGLPQVREMVSAYTINSVEITNPTEFTYTANVTLTAGEEEITFDVEFNFLALEYGEDYYLNFITDPFMFGPMTVDMTLAEAEAAIFAYYNDLINPSYDVTLFCNTYVMNTVNNEATLEECIEGVTVVRGYLDEFNIVTVTETVINPPEGESFNGFVATITLATTDGTGDVDIYFAFFNVDGEPSLTLFGSPLGDDGGGGQPVSVYLTEEQARSEINIFYDLLNDDTVTTADFCYLFVLMNDDMSPMDAEECAAFKTMHDNLEIRTYEVGVIIYIEGQDGGPSVYVATVTRTINGVVKEYDVLFFFFDDNASGFYLMTPGNNAIGEYDMQAGGGDGPEIAIIDLATAESMIAQYYLDAVDVTITDAEFCAMYFTLATTMEPLDSAACEALRAAAVIDGFVFVATDVTFYEGQDGGPSYYEATITATVGTIVKEFKAMFIFIVGGDSNPMLATQFEVSIGNVFMLDMAPYDVDFADTMPDQSRQGQSGRSRRQHS